MRNLLALLVVVLVLTGCSALPRTERGDSYSAAVLSNGAPTWARTVDDEKLCEWFYPDWHTTLSPWLIVAFDLAEWEWWLERRNVGEGKLITVDSKTRTISVDGVDYATRHEPRAKWVRYDVGAAWRSR